MRLRLLLIASVSIHSVRIDSQALRRSKLFNRVALCQGMTSVVPQEHRGNAGFSPCGKRSDFAEKSLEAYFRG
jgi:hypothetical protein